jgi:phosphatidate cytidylyltransferase
MISLNEKGVSENANLKMNNSNMLVKRILSGIVIIVIGLALTYAGGWIYAAGLGIILAIAAWEYARLFETGGYAPAKLILTLGTFAIALSGKFLNSIHSEIAFGLVILAIILNHILTYGRHQDTAAFDLSISLGGVVFIAFLGLFLVRLRFLPNGMFWLFQCLLPAGLSDVGAFGVGMLFGKHKIAPTLSPHKTIEGYLGGVATAVLIGLGTGLVLGRYNSAFNSVRGLWLGLIIGAICPLGDFAKSIIKRQFGAKNTGTLIPGHGGVLDRIDTWLIAGIVSYFMINLFFM